MLCFVLIVGQLRRPIQSSPDAKLGGGRQWCCYGTLLARFHIHFIIIPNQALMKFTGGLPVYYLGSAIFDLNVR